VQWEGEKKEGRKEGRKDNAEAQRAQRFRREERGGSTDLDPNPRPTRKIGVWGTREKPRETQEHRLKPMLPVGGVFVAAWGGIRWRERD